MVYVITIETVRLNYFKVPEAKDWIDKATPLIKEIFGYTDEEIEGFKTKIFYPPLAIDVTLEQAKLAMQPFVDYGMSTKVSATEYDEQYNIVKNWIDLGLTRQTPKMHYYDEPIIRRDQLIDPYNPPTWRSEWTTGFTFKPISTAPTITCPYCKSTNCKKISNLSKAGSVFLWGIFAMGKTMKEWHCNNCNSDF